MQEEEGEYEDSDAFVADYGKHKMEIFKQQCRNILNGAVPDNEPADVLDIVTAYKSLKLAVNKTHYGLDKGRDHINGKGYLKPTISTK